MGISHNLPSLRGIECSERFCSNTSVSSPFPPSRPGAHSSLVPCLPSQAWTPTLRPGRPRALLGRWLRRRARLAPPARSLRPAASGAVTSPALGPLPSRARLPGYSGAAGGRDALPHIAKRAREAGRKEQPTDRGAEDGRREEEPPRRHRPRPHRPPGPAPPGARRAGRGPGGSPELREQVQPQS